MSVGLSQKPLILNYIMKIVSNQLIFSVQSINCDKNIHPWSLSFQTATKGREWSEAAQIKSKIYNVLNIIKLDFPPLGLGTRLKICGHWTVMGLSPSHILLLKLNIFTETIKTWLPQQPWDSLFSLKVLSHKLKAGKILMMITDYWCVHPSSMNGEGGKIYKISEMSNVSCVLNIFII